MSNNKKKAQKVIFKDQTFTHLSIKNNYFAAYVLIVCSVLTFTCEALYNLSPL